MKVNKIDNGSVVELTTTHKLNGDCTCGATVSTVATKDGSGYARYNYSKVYTHKGKNFTDNFLVEFAKRFPNEI
jgi:hypothetical protein